MNVANAVFEIMVPRQGEVIVRLCQLGNIFQKPPWLHLQNLHFFVKVVWKLFQFKKIIFSELGLRFLLIETFSESGGINKILTPSKAVELETRLVVNNS